ncbi:MAG: 50S ribosomal protein L28 [Alphaproteobacteria bacterium]|nr:50S ribosomal protein L28 [Alphaproteobacteria bacterium]MCZ6763465.1 50S ribosomal protein L28 [Alphaproteobacteria bacterium]
MARRCSVTGKGVMTGNNVSHAHNKTRRRFLPNLQATTLYSESLDRGVRVRVTPAALRTIEHNGGLDAWLTKTKSADLDGTLRRLKKQVAKAAPA